MSSAGKVLIYGGKGALGSTCIDVFKANGWKIFNVDLFENASAAVNILVGTGDDLQTQANKVNEGLAAALGGDKLDAVLCVAGGWAGGNAKAANFIKNVDLTLKQSVWSSAIASQVAAQHLKEGGLLQLTGAEPARHPTPGMIGYGAAKAYVHQMVKSLSVQGCGLPKGTSVLAILPVTLDTPMNRQGMPNADHSSWTPLAFVAETLLGWSGAAEMRPKTGSLVELITAGGVTELRVTA